MWRPVGDAGKPRKPFGPQRAPKHPYNRNALADDLSTLADLLPKTGGAEPSFEGLPIWPEPEPAPAPEPTKRDKAKSDLAAWTSQLAGDERDQLDGLAPGLLAAAAEASTSATPTFAEGDFVTVFGLKGRKELNDKIGKVVGPAEESGRYPVAIDASECARSPEPAAAEASAALRCRPSAYAHELCSRTARPPLPPTRSSAHAVKTGKVSILIRPTNLKPKEVDGLIFDGQINLAGEWFSMDEFLSYAARSRSTSDLGELYL